MRRTITVLATVASGEDKIYGTSVGYYIGGIGRGDYLCGRAGGDTVVGDSGADRVYVLKGSDRVYGGPGKDSMTTYDGKSDYVDCGTGKDSFYVDRFDRFAANCEEVSTPVWG